MTKEEEQSHLLSPADEVAAAANNINEGADGTALANADEHVDASRYGKIIGRVLEISRF